MKAPRTLRSATRAVVLLAAAGCGSGDPQRILERLASTAATARLAIAERASGAIPQRYAERVLEQSAAAARESAAQLDEAKSLPHDPESRALLVALEVASTAERAAADTAWARGAARSLDSLARDAAWLAAHAKQPE